MGDASKNVKSKSNNSVLKWMLYSSLITCLIPLIFGAIVVKKRNWDFTELGPFGDFFAGSTVPVFTMISSIGLIITLRMQKQQLEMQGKELQNSIMEMQATREEIKEQSKTMFIQRFESTFFNMLNLHNEIVKGTAVYDVYNKFTAGRKVFPALLGQLKVMYDDTSVYNEEIRPDYEVQQAKMKHAYAHFFEEYEPDLGHYYRNLYRIVIFIHEASLTEEEKLNYIGIIKSQLSSYELILLFYFVNSEYGQKFKPVAKKYRMFENLNESLLFSSVKEFELFNGEEVEAV